MKNNNSTTRSFGYKASRDIIMAFVEIAILFLGWLVVKEAFIWIEKNLFNANEYEIKIAIRYTKWFWFGFYIITVIRDTIMEIINHCFSSLSIDKKEIIYNYGWLNKKTTTIPANKIRSCTKSSGVLQRICGTMNISITTTGDSAEIYFWCIDDGDEAYELISQIAKENGNS